ncbi:uncharacterized protein LY89DRAFT_759615 [Mollisia scopiformis]|uniref:2EXR domain-containing protein n=1 Tax=Mollisia scopiformis TaxID=149040 RepID=A0A194WSU2_MOLSC|nr:uncharacterized protein LY89DRAFT_759615 [Mollisia scopiformis]KUJ10749.1 hypothetical protein LY89DRAFT_759615 [Mollisia scopiformis]
MASKELAGALAHMLFCSITSQVTENKLQDQHNRKPEGARQPTLQALSFFVLATMSTSTFHAFSRLPPELRRMVWLFALPSPRVLSVHDLRVRRLPKWRIVYSAIDISCEISQGYPVILAVNSESRVEALRYYSMLHGLQEFCLMGDCLIKTTYYSRRFASWPRIPQLVFLEHPWKAGHNMMIRQAAVEENYLPFLRPEACCNLEELHIVIHIRREATDTRSENWNTTMAERWNSNIAYPESKQAKVYHSGDTIEKSDGWGNADKQNKFLRKLEKASKGNGPVVKLVRTDHLLRKNHDNPKNDRFCFPTSATPGWLDWGGCGDPWKATKMMKPLFGLREGKP